MAKSISKKSVEDINAKCKNDFHFDLQDFLERGTKKLCRIIKLQEDKKIIKLTLWWRDEVVRNKNQYGCTISKNTGNVLPELHCAVWHKCTNSSCWIHRGLAGSHPFSDHPSPKRMINALCAATELVTDELILSLLPEWEKEESRRILLANQNQPD